MRAWQSPIAPIRSVPLSALPGVCCISIGVLLLLDHPFIAIAHDNQLQLIIFGRNFNRQDFVTDTGAKILRGERCVQRRR